MKIQSIHLEGFMAHADTTLELVPGTNLLRGPNRVGKSCVVRALDWLLFDRGPRWSDDDRMELLHEGADFACVTVVWDTGLVTARYRDAKTQELRIGDRRLTSGVRDWPGLITEATGIRREDLANGVADALNFSFQNDPVFLLGLPPEKIDQALGRLTGAGNLEGAIALARTDRTRADREVKRLEPVCNALAAEAAALAAVPAVSALVGLARADEDAASDADYALRQVEGLVGDIDGLLLVDARVIAKVRTDLGLAGAALDTAVASAQTTTAVLRIVTELQDLPLVPEAALGTVHNLVHEGNALRSNAEALHRWITEVSAIVDGSAFKELPVSAVQCLIDESVADGTTVDNIIGTARGVTGLQQEISGLDREILDAGDTVADSRGRLVKLQFEEAAILESLEVCPLCGQRIPQGVPQ